MSTFERQGDLNEMELVNENKPGLQLIKGGRDENPPEDPNWLEKLKVGAVFVAKPKHEVKMWQAVEWEIKNHQGRIMLLETSLSEPKQETWADTYWFSQGWRLLEVLYDGD